MGNFKFAGFFFHPVLFLVTRLTLHDFFHFPHHLIPITILRGESRKLKEGRGGDRTPLLERGEGKTAFERSFQCFSHTYFVKFSRKGRGGGAAAPSAPLKSVHVHNSNGLT